MRILVCVVGSVILLSGCSTVSENYSWSREQLGLAVSGLDRTLDANRIAEYEAERKEVIDRLGSLAGVTGSSSEFQKDEWLKIAVTGLEFVDNECHAYMSALYRIDQIKREGSQQINLIGTTAVAIMGILEAAAKEIALVAGGFGFLQAFWTNAGSSFLFDLEPSAVDAIVETMQDSHREKLDLPLVETSTDAMRVIYRYAELCTPIRIERAVNTAVREANTRSVASGLDVRTNVVGGQQ